MPKGDFTHLHCQIHFSLSSPKQIKFPLLSYEKKITNKQIKISVMFECDVLNF